MASRYADPDMTYPSAMSSLIRSFFRSYDGRLELSYHLREMNAGHPRRDVLQKGEEIDPVFPGYQGLREAFHGLIGDAQIHVR